ncbi:MAG: hypothetical protein CL868_12665 [Cytophagaceae bacterium]|nr:hypothetical protein [Cytophagaceae bacterium]
MRFLWAILFFPFLALSQNITVTPLDTVFNLKNSRFVGADTSLYYIEGPILHKTDRHASMQYSDVQLGDITTVDILNPLRITLFYAEFNTVVILDNTLNEITRIDFNQPEHFRNVSHARTASDRKLWIFNIDLQQLELFDYRSNTVTQTFSPQGNTAIEMTSDFNNCWILTDAMLYHYNRYGSLISREPITTIHDIQVIDEVIWAIKDDKLVARLKNSTAWTVIKDNFKATNGFYLNGGNLYIYADGFISFNHIALPKKQ